MFTHKYIKYWYKTKRLNSIHSKVCIVTGFMILIISSYYLLLYILLIENIVLGNTFYTVLYVIYIILYIIT